MLHVVVAAGVQWQEERSLPYYSYRSNMSSKDDVKMGEEVETEEEYIHRVYGTTSNNDRDRGKDAAEQTGLVRRLSRSLSSEFHRRRRSSLKENLPQTYYGWTVFLSTISSMVLRYEMRLQKSLTCPPVVYGQVKEGPLKEIYGQMTKSETSILVCGRSFTLEMSCVVLTLVCVCMSCVIAET